MIDDALILELSSQESLQDVRDLTLRSHSLTTADLEPVLVKLPHLQLLSLSHNLLHQIPMGFSHLQQLCSLNINHNHVDSLEGLRSCTSLRELYAANNRIGDLAPLSCLKNLAKLSLFSNAVASLEQCMRALHGLPLLQDLELEGNPIASEPLYRQQAICQLSSLQSLDGELVTPAERLAVAERAPPHVPTSDGGKGHEPERNQVQKHTDRGSEGSLHDPSVTSMSSAVEASTTTSNQQQQQQQQQHHQQQQQAHRQGQQQQRQGQQPHPQTEGRSRPSSSSSTPSHTPSTQTTTTTAQQVQPARSASAGASLDGSRLSNGGVNTAIVAGLGASKSSSKAGELWRPRCGSADAGSGSWGKVVTGAGESMPPKPRGSRPSTPGKGGVQLVSDELLNDHPLLLEYLAKHVLAAGLKEVQQQGGSASNDGCGGVGRARGSFAKRLRDAASAMAATENLAPHELASSSAIQAALPASSPSSTAQINIVTDLVAAASPHELIRQLIKLSEVLIQELNTARRAASQATGVSSSRPDSSQTSSSTVNPSADGIHPGRPDKLAPLVRQPSLGASSSDKDLQGVLQASPLRSSLHQVPFGGISRGPQASQTSQQRAAGSVGSRPSTGRGAMSEGGGAHGEGGQHVQGELLAEVEQLRREVKQLRIENCNVYWLDDECKKLKAELQAVLQKP